MENSVSAEALLEQLQAIALADVTAVVQVQDGALTVQDTGHLPRQLRLAISSVEKSAGCFKVKFYDKLKALELLGKYLHLFEQPVEDSAAENDLLATICRSTGEVMDVCDLPEIQQAAAAGDELVESAGIS